MYPSPDEYLLMLRSQIKSFSRVFIVLDALDECLDDAETNTMNSFLKALDQLPQNIHVLFTSRHDISIGQRVRADRELEIFASKRDLKIYLESRINSLENLRRLVDTGVQKDRFFLDRVLDTIVARSQGMQVLHHNDSLCQDFADIYTQVSARPTPHGIPCL
jgi:hypothetical protein